MFREGMAQRLLTVHWPGAGGTPISTIILDARSVSHNYRHPFRARLVSPPNYAARWNYTDLGGVRGQYIVGRYQAGLGGDYAYGENRADPPTSNPDEAFSCATIRLPTNGEYQSSYLWSVGAPLPPDGIGYCSLIINAEKIWAEGTTWSDGSRQPIRIETASSPIFDGNGYVDYRWRMFGGFYSDGSRIPNMPNFSLDADEQVLVTGMDLLEEKTLSFSPSLTYGTAENIY